MDPWASNSLDLNSYLNGGSGLTGAPATIGAAQQYQAAEVPSWNWGADLSYLLRTGTNAWAATKVQQAANGSRYYEGYPVAYTQSTGLVLTPQLLLLVGVGLFAYMAAKA